MDETPKFEDGGFLLPHGLVTRNVDAPEIVVTEEDVVRYMRMFPVGEKEDDQW